METVDLELLIVNRLKINGDTLSDQFLAGNRLTTTRFFILDDLLPVDLVAKLYKDFPRKEKYVFRDTFREKKYTFTDTDSLESSLPGQVIDALQSESVIQEIKNITKMPGLSGDPSLYAGGLSRMDQGHFLNPHIDNSHDAQRKKYRRLNSLFYMSPGLQESDGGSLELWDKKVQAPVRLYSKFNRLIVMETNKTSWHSVNPVSSDVVRCCVSNYYFTPSSPTGEDYYHVTSFTGRPEQPFWRIYGRVDNFLRQKVATILGISRGKNLSRKLD